jgi:hypothetical protein
MRRRRAELKAAAVVSPSLPPKIKPAPRAPRQHNNKKTDTTAAAAAAPVADQKPSSRKSAEFQKWRERHNDVPQLKDSVAASPS